VIACQAENNVPVVGKEEVLNHREMHWLRIDRYLEGDGQGLQAFFQPLLCMHCEKAPCEPVCPVNATVHSSEGLNEMVYARCIGVRYCSHNCPYKVRRFNHFQYADEDILPLNLARNPDVTVRKRGVIEKCTFCVQRINYARSKAKIENRRIQEGELMTACQQACPARAIVFGDLNNPESQVIALKQQPHDYGLLAELGTQPRLTYLAQISNRHSDLEQHSDGESLHD
jgi:Fe-S-cluster-containing dehydrogenase component